MGLKDRGANQSVLERGNPAGSCSPCEPSYRPFLFYHGSAIRALGKLRLPAIFSAEVCRSIRSLGTKPKRTAFRSPWQNGTAERWVGSCRREILDHVIVFDEDHLRRLLSDYFAYYNHERVHTRLQDAPEGRALQTRPSSDARIIGLARVGGLHHRYIWKKAA